MSDTEKKQDAPAEYPSMHKRIIIMLAVYLTVFIITLDQNIISTAIPRITDEFDSINDIAWYGSAYLLTMCSFQLLMGKVYKYYKAKPLFLGGIIVFEVGSTVCGAAPSSTAFIVGRAIAGLGSSGMFSGMMVVMFHTVPLQQRPIFQGFFGAVFAVASVIGPLIGGTFTDKVTWRWCFYINLPVGAVAAIVAVFLLKIHNQKLDAQATSWTGKLKQLDPIGNLVFFPGIICLILALQWGGTTYSWQNARIIVLLVVCGVLVLVFAGIQIWKKEDATVPPRIMKQRSVAGAMWFGFFNGASLMVIMYYVPVWFQAIKGVSAVKSGIMLLPLVLATVITSISSGIVITRIGYYTPFFYLSPIMCAIGAGLLSTLTPTSGHAEWIGYQVILGVGFGFGAQQPLNVVQTVLERSDISTGSAIVMFTRFLGSSIFLPIAQNVFVSRLVSKLSNLPNISRESVIKSGATDLRNLVSGNDLSILLSDYNDALRGVFYIVAAASAATLLGGVFVEWRSLKARAAEQAGKKKDEANEASSKAEVAEAEETAEAMEAVNIEKAAEVV